MKSSGVSDVAVDKRRAEGNFSEQLASWRKTLASHLGRLGPRNIEAALIIEVGLFRRIKILGVLKNEIIIVVLITSLTYIKWCLVESFDHGALARTMEDIVLWNRMRQSTVWKNILSASQSTGEQFITKVSTIQIVSIHIPIRYWTIKEGAFA